MNIPELKKSLEYFEQNSYPASAEEYAAAYKQLQTLLSACQLLCDVSDKMEPEMKWSIGYQHQDLYDAEKRGYDQRRSEDILWLTKKMMGIEEVIKTELDKYGLVIVAINGGEEATGDFIANAIRQEMGGEK